MTARTSKPGVSGITAEDLDALDQGRTTLQSIADRLGCTKQNISRKIRTMRATAPTGPGIPTTPTTGASIPAGSVLIDVQQAIVSANLGIIFRAAGLLEGGDVLGPSAVKALSGAIASARAELTALGVLAPDDADTALSVLTVRTMSDTEHDAIKAAAEEMNEFD